MGIFEFLFGFAFAEKKTLIVPVIKLSIYTKMLVNARLPEKQDTLAGAIGSIEDRSKPSLKNNYLLVKRGYLRGNITHNFLLNSDLLISQCVMVCEKNI